MVVAPQRQYSCAGSFVRIESTPSYLSRAEISEVQVLLKQSRVDVCSRPDFGFYLKNITVRREIEWRNQWIQNFPFALPSKFSRRQSLGNSWLLSTWPTFQDEVSSRMDRKIATGGTNGFRTPEDGFSVALKNRTSKSEVSILGEDNQIWGNMAADAGLSNFFLCISLKYTFLQFCRH
jgi:hypothetical protein